MQKVKLSNLGEDYLWELDRRIEKSSWSNHASTVRRLAAWYDTTRRSPASLDVAMLNSWLYGDRATGWAGASKGLSNGGFNNVLNHVKRFASWLEERDVIKSASKIEAMTARKRVDTEKHRIDRPQMRQMLSNATDPWERWLLVLGLETAGRASELSGLQWRDLRTSGRTLMWYRQKTKQYDELTAMPLLLREAVVWRTHLTERGFDVSDDSYMVPARRYAAHKGFIYFPGTRCRPITIGCVIKRHLLQFFTPEELQGEAAHVLRRSAARELYEVWKEMGVSDPMRKVQALLGHSSISQTEVYIGIQRDRVERNELMDGLDWLAVSDEGVVDMEAFRGRSRSV